MLRTEQVTGALVGAAVGVAVGFAVGMAVGVDIWVSQLMIQPRWCQQLGMRYTCTDPYGSVRIRTLVPFE